MKFLVTNKKIDAEIAGIGFKPTYEQFGPFTVLTELQNQTLDTKFHLVLMDGYLRNLKLPIDEFQRHLESSVAKISNDWPIPEYMTGSFSALFIDKKYFNLILCNDLMGVYPLYYLFDNTGFYISNSIILMGAISNSKFDEAGIIQRCMGPEFSNIGSRTILEDCKRLLPGEYLKFDKDGHLLEKRFDNTLYHNISGPSQKQEISKEFWANYKKEIDYCTNYSKVVNIALSGGIDSRITLGAISNEKEIRCLTFGGKNNYETKISARLAKIKKARFNSFSKMELFFLT